MPTQRTPVSFAFQGCRGRRVTASFNGGTITSHAGALLLRKIERPMGLFDRVAACFTDHRDPARTEHSVSTLVAQRIVALALGYEDLNDHDHLRHDPVLGLLGGKTAGTRKGCAALAGKSTLNRLEHAPEGEPGRYRRIAHDPEGLQNLLTDLFVESKTGAPPSRLVLDIDCTDDPTHGRQEGRFFHGYYGHYCFLPLYIFCGHYPLAAVLRPGNTDPAQGAVEQLERIVARLRKRWPSGSPESNIPTGNRLTVYRTARSAFPAVGLDLAGPSRQSGETGVNRRDSRAGRTGLSNRVREPLWSHHIRRSPKLDFRSPRFHLWWVRRRPRDVATGLIPPDSVSREGMS